MGLQKKWYSDFRLCISWHLKCVSCIGTLLEDDTISETHFAFVCPYGSSILHLVFNETSVKGHVREKTVGIHITYTLVRSKLDVWRKNTWIVIFFLEGAYIKPARTGWTLYTVIPMIDQLLLYCLYISDQGDRRNTRQGRRTLVHRRPAVVPDTRREGNA